MRRNARLMLADNRIAQDAGWDLERLNEELAELPELLADDGLEISVTGFEPAEIDRLSADFEDRSRSGRRRRCRWSGWSHATRVGDLWQLDKHRLLCGDARHSDDLARLLGDERAHMAFLDPPYNVKSHNVVGRGALKHREFAMASGEMDPDAFISFLSEASARRRGSRSMAPFTLCAWTGAMSESS